MLSVEFDKQGLVSPQFGILRLLQLLGPMSQITLGQDLGIDKASMVKFIDGIEKKNGSVVSQIKTTAASSLLP